MARFPDAEWRPISKSRYAIQPKIVCVHTMVGTLRGTDNYFRDHGVDSHFGVGNDTDGTLDGVVYQWVDTGEKANANLRGNDVVVSIETSDGGNPNNPWSPKALDAIVAIIAWACQEHDISARLIDGNEPGSEGIAYHRQGCDHGGSYSPKGWPYDQWRVPNGVLWSHAVGKVCPGNVRIRQLVDVVIPRVQALLSDDPPEGDDDMAFTDDQEKQLKRLADEPGAITTALQVHRSLKTLDPPSDGTFAKWAALHLRNHPSVGTKDTWLRRRFAQLLRHLRAS